MKSKGKAKANSMKNGKHMSHKSHKAETIAARVLVGVATLGALVVLLRSLPDLVRYMRVRRM